MKLLNRVRFATATTGTSDIAIGAAVRSASDGDCLTPAEAGAANGDRLVYFIVDGNNFAHGTGVYSTTGPTLARDAGEKRWNGSTYAAGKLTLSGAAKVFVTLDDATLGQRPLVRTLAAAETRTSATYTLIADANGDWTFPVAAGKTYHVKVRGFYRGSNTSGGIGIRPTLTSGAGTFAGMHFYKLNGIPAAAEFVPIAASSDEMLLSGVSAANTDFLYTCDFVFVCTTSGVMQMQMCGESSYTATLQAGAALIVDEY